MRTIWSLFFSMSLIAGQVMAQEETQIYGYIEKATLTDKNFALSAKLDTGAKSASLNASNITEIKVDNEPYLRFTVSTKNGDEVFQAKYMGKVKIKVRENEAGGASTAEPIKRPMVMLNIQLGDKVRSIKVNLTNRKRFLYPLLLGRDAIVAFNGAVNPALVFTLKSKSIKS